MIKNGRPWHKAAWPVVKWSTVIGLLLGFLAGGASVVGGNTISVNGSPIDGWYGVWLLTFALGIAGLVFGLIWALVFRAIAHAAHKH